MKIYKTQNYDQFKTIMGNRQLNRAHIGLLEESFGKRNLLEYHPILVNDTMDVIDGQHRLEVARALGLPVYYVMVNDAGIEDVQMLNANSRSWSVKDYLDSYIARGYQDYSMLKEFALFHKLSVSIAIFLLQGINLGSGSKGGVLREFKAGDFKIKTLKKAEDFAIKLNDIRPYVEKTVAGDRDFMAALDIVFRKGGTQKRLVQKMSQHEKMTRKANVKDYLRELEDVYNFKTREENKIRFY